MYLSPAHPPPSLLVCLVLGMTTIMMRFVYSLHPYFMFMPVLLRKPKTALFLSLSFIKKQGGSFKPSKIFDAQTIVLFDSHASFMGIRSGPYSKFQPK